MSVRSSAPSAGRRVAKRDTTQSLIVTTVEENSVNHGGALARTTTAMLEAIER